MRHLLGAVQEEALEIMATTLGAHTDFRDVEAQDCRPRKRLVVV